ncbi:threonine dehydratase [Gottschalkia acidurici 9a]|uniref:L-threonine dehydratase catabolic TdcB n=1 Tax=Gottschalkia acidurici (strain ATCC 7906 / DSM 604 / BCRC 14475 / CIP 104303 / KCTC 5404 / NCIMB 10678 / 9a) TaxID=1128398 RepID=K0B059_GOTA9|nr:threonine ammonia-lyase [Gottschalkia acidurici]AFS79418.1 threonine dehydratase [Gottschalkia acidurici 9a]
MTVIDKQNIEGMNFENSRKLLDGILTETRLIKSLVFSKEFENDVYIKPENLQTTGSFKIRGAFNKISKLTEEDKSKGLIASSAGNHAQGVAYAAQKLGVEATIVMPTTTPLIKVEATKSYGAKVILHGDCYDEAYKEALRLKKENGYIFIHPFNDLDVIEGQGTIATEILEELKDVDCILVPIGGGGLAAGIAISAKKINPNIKVIGVEPEGAKSMKASIEKGELICLDKVCTIADGVAVKEPGDITFSIIKEYIDEIVEVSDFDIMEAFLILLDKHKLIGENAGVSSLAGLKKIKEKNKKIVCIVSGGNIDVLTMASMIDRGLVSRGRIFSFTVDLPDKPGELLKVAEVLARTGANVIKLDHNQLKSMDRFMEVQLEVTVETNGHKHIEQIISELKSSGYDVIVL